jgi:nucleoside-diphosphate-sugar epimerase
MTRRAFILGGSGQIGRAVAARLAGEGWSVTCAQRTSNGFPNEVIDQGVEAVALDRDDTAALRDALSRGFDAVVDTIAYNASHARQWLGLQDLTGALAVISTGSVYAGEQGRTLDEARETGPPIYPVPIREDQPSTSPGDANYSTRKVELEDLLLEGIRVPLTILRPFAVHGPGSRAPREWWFIARALTGAANIPVAYDGMSRFHTSATANIAELCRVAFDCGGTHVLNAADPEALTVAEIGQAILCATASPARLSLFPGPPRKYVGATPWSVASPIVADMSAAAALGYCPITDYRGSIETTCRTLIEAANQRGWREAFPGLSAYPPEMFDIAASGSGEAAAET